MGKWLASATLIVALAMSAMAMSAMAMSAMATSAMAAHARRHIIHHRHLRPHHLSVEMSTNASTPNRRYQAAGLREPGVRTSYERRLGKSGAVASFGYHPGAVAPTLNRTELDGAAATRLGNSESTAGAQVKIPF